VLPVIGAGSGLAEAVSADGSIIVGATGSPTSRRIPVRWNNAGTVEALPLPSPNHFGVAIAMSADGEVILGSCWPYLAGTNNLSVLWIRGELIELRTLLANHGVNQTLANALIATNISADGRFLTAYHYSGFTLNSGTTQPYLIELRCMGADFDCDGDTGTDADIEAFFRCLDGACPAPPCHSSADIDGDGDVGTDRDIEEFFATLSSDPCMD
jgi:hypothetical protein